MVIAYGKLTGLFIGGFLSVEYGESYSFGFFSIFVLDGEIKRIFTAVFYGYNSASVGIVYAFSHRVKLHIGILAEGSPLDRKSVV